MMKNSLGEEMTAPDILTSTKEDDDEVQGHIYSSDEKSTKEDKKIPPSTWKGIGAGGTGSGT
jgi:hypothetical protein